MSKPSAEYRSWYANRWATVNRQHYRITGVRMCPAWFDSFEVFLKDMGKKPTPRHRLTRMDVSGDFDAQNCIWALPEEIPYIQERYRKVVFKGQDYAVRELAEMANIPYRTMFSRVCRKDTGYLRTRQEKRKGPFQTPLGVFVTVKEAATAHQQNLQTVYKRLSRGDDLLRALRV